MNSELSLGRTEDIELLNWLRQPATLDRGFRALLERYQEPLYWHIRRMVTDHEDTNDVLQNVLVKVFRNIQKFEGKSSLYTWLYRIATNETLTFLQQRKRKKVESLDSEQLMVAEQLRADPYFDGSAAQVRLQQALTTLPEKQRLVFSMRYFEGMPYQAISDILDTSVGALKASYHHAVKKIEHFIMTHGADNFRQ